MKEEIVIDRIQHKKEREFMPAHIHFRTSSVVLLATCLIAAGCNAFAVPVHPTSTARPASGIPDWFNIKMTDVRTGQTFSMSDFKGKVVLLETMAAWCGTCLLEQREVKKLEGLTGNSKDLVHVSLDTDFNEDAGMLKEYANLYGFDWYFAISPLEVDRALGNLYSAEFMNPPLAPMLIIDRQGNVNSLPWGLKGADALHKTLTPYLNQ